MGIIWDPSLVSLECWKCFQKCTLRYFITFELNFSILYFNKIIIYILYFIWGSQGTLQLDALLLPTYLYNFMNRFYLYISPSICHIILLVMFSPVFWISKFRVIKFMKCLRSSRLSETLWRLETRNSWKITIQNTRHFWAFWEPYYCCYNSDLFSS